MSNPQFKPKPGKPRSDRGIKSARLTRVVAKATARQQSWLQRGPESLIVSPDPACFGYTLLVGVVPAGLMFWMIRRAAPIAPITTMGLGTLAAAAFAAAALRLFHNQDMSVIVLVWQVGTVAVLSVAGALTGKYFLRWPTWAGRRAT